MADDEVHISSSMDGELEAALARLEKRLDGVEEKLAQVRVAGKQAGDGVEAGMDKGARATDRAKRASAAAAPEIKKAGNEMAKAGAKGATAASGVDRFADKMEKAGKKAGKLGSILSVYKWAGIVTGFYALAGGVSALGAGAVIALGGIAPITGVLAALPAVLLGVKLSMLAVHLAADQLADPMTRIKTQFTELGPVIAAGGLRAGLDHFADSLGGLVKVAGTGLTGFGSEMGVAATQLGVIAKSPPFLAQVRSIFAGLRPVLRNVLAGLIAIARALLNVIQASLPMVQSMSEMFLAIAQGTQQWTAAQLANGRMAAWLNKSWDLLRRTIGVIVDVLIGLFNIFRIGAGYAGAMGLSIEAAAYKFRLWTDSAAGQARINQYFQDSLPALHEMGRLVGMLLGGLARLGASQNVAPLLKQINDELAPALGRLVGSFTGVNGLGSALISALAALANFMTQLDSSVLVTFADAITRIINGLTWIGQNVPGATFLMSTLLQTFLAFKLLGPVFSLVGRGAKAFAWIAEAHAMTGELSFMQKMIGGILLPSLRTAAKGFGTLAMSGVKAIGSLSVALFTTPIGWLILGIMALIAVIILLWVKCAWFRDLVMGAWAAIKIAFLVAVGALRAAWLAVMTALVAVVRTVVGTLVATWQMIVAVATAVWQGLVVAWQVVWGIMAPIVRVVWNIIKFIIQTAVYIIVGIITLIAIIVKGVYDDIIGATKIAWGIIKVVFNFIAGIAEWTWGIVRIVAVACWNFIAGIATWTWTTILLPIFNFILSVSTFIWNGVASIAQFCWGIISAGAQILWTSTLQPIFSFIAAGAKMLWDGVSFVASGAVLVITTIWQKLSGFLSGAFNIISGAASGMWDGIKAGATIAGNIISGIWNGIVNIVKGVWNIIARLWNAIPSIHVPDWVPGIGGKTFGLPKLPLLYRGGPTPGGPAIVGEQGPELLVRGGRVAGVLGANGPAMANLPRGGYVVPNMNTILAGMAKPIPAPVAAAIAAAPAPAGVRSDGLGDAVRELAHAVRTQRPPLAVTGGDDTVRAVKTALADYDREQRARGVYHYTAGRG